MIIGVVTSRMKTCELCALIIGEHGWDENIGENRCETLPIISNLGRFGKSMKMREPCAMITG